MSNVWHLPDKATITRIVEDQCETLRKLHPDCLLTEFIIRRIQSFLQAARDHGDGRFARDDFDYDTKYPNLPTDLQNAICNYVSCHIGDPSTVQHLGEGPIRYFLGFTQSISEACSADDAHRSCLAMMRKLKSGGSSFFDVFCEATAGYFLAESGFRLRYEFREPTWDSNFDWLAEDENVRALVEVKAFDPASEFGVVNADAGPPLGQTIDLWNEEGEKYGPHIKKLQDKFDEAIGKFEKCSIGVGTYFRVAWIQSPSNEYEWFDAKCAIYPGYSPVARWKPGTNEPVEMVPSNSAVLSSARNTQFIDALVFLHFDGHSSPWHIHEARPEAAESIKSLITALEKEAPLKT